MLSFLFSVSDVSCLYPASACGLLVGWLEWMALTRSAAKVGGSVLKGVGGASRENEALLWLAMVSEYAIRFAWL